MFRQNEKKIVTTVIVGVGDPSIATDCHIPGTQAASNLMLVGLCDVSPKIYDWAQKHGVKAYQDFQDVLNDPQIQMVQIATPDWLHWEQAEQALCAGKHVLLQKPPCLTKQDLDSMARLVRSSQCRLKVILNQRQTALSRTIKQLVDTGRIGELCEIQIRFLGHRYPISNLNSPYLKASSGGVWIHNGLHWLDEAYLYSGHLPTDVQLFTTRNGNGPDEMLGEGSNYWSAIFNMGRVTFHFEYNAMLMAEGLPAGMYRTLIGTRGEIRQEPGGDDIILYEVGKQDPSHIEVNRDDCVLENDMKDSFRIGLEKFGNEILNDIETEPYIEDSLYLMGCLFDALEADRMNEVVSLGVTK